MAHGFHRFALRKVAAAATVGAHAGKKIGGYGNVARRGHLIRKILHPIRHAEDFVNDQHDGSLALRLGVDDEGFDRAAIVLNGHPLAVPW